jgi:hypothetical protein
MDSDVVHKNTQQITGFVWFFRGAVNIGAQGLAAQLTVHALACSRDLFCATYRTLRTAMLCMCHCIHLHFHFHALTWMLFPYTWINTPGFCTATSSKKLFIKPNIHGFCTTAP